MVSLSLKKSISYQAPHSWGLLFVGLWVDLVMIRYISLLLFLGLAFTQDITIAVFDFKNNGLEPHEVRQLSTRLESELVNVGNYKG